MTPDDLKMEVTLFWYFDLDFILVNSNLHSIEVCSQVSPKSFYDWAFESIYASVNGHDRWMDAETDGQKDPKAQTALWGGWGYNGQFHKLFQN